MKLVAFRIFAWLLLLGSAVGSFVAAVAVSERGWLQFMILDALEFGPLGNWTLCFITLSLGLSVYILRGSYGGGWSVSFLPMASIPLMALGLLIFGLRGLVVFGFLSGIASVAIMTRRQHT